MFIPLDFLPRQTVCNNGNDDYITDYRPSSPVV